MTNHVVITITRDFGAEGHAVGEKLADRLGIPLYDKDILGRAAQKSKVDVTSVSNADEAVTTRFIEPYLLLSMGTTNKNDALFEAEEKVIRDVAAKESCIIVGRLSDYLLRNDVDCIKTYIHAPLAFRVENIMEKHNISESAAKKLVKKMDAVRESYCKYYSNGKWSHKKDKDMILNRASLGVDGCVAAIEAVVKEKLRK